MPRVRLLIPERKIFSTKIRVRITDINYGNHLGNDALIGILHEARMQWLYSLNYTELNIEGASLIMADLAVEYKGESFYGDVLIIDISIGEITKASFEIYYQVTTNRNDNKVAVAKAKTGLVCYNYKEKKVKELPEIFLNKLKI